MAKTVPYLLKAMCPKLFKNSKIPNINVCVTIKAIMIVKKFLGKFFLANFFIVKVIVALRLHTKRVFLPLS